MQAKEASSPTISSEEESVEEDFDWAYDKNCPDEIKKEFLKFPLEKWGKILFGPNFDFRSTILPGDNYKNKVNRILKYHVFNNFKFYEHKKEILNFNLYEYYKIKKDKIEQRFILPDFFIYKIESENFFEILEKRSYMMSFNNKINQNKKYISIIGVIKKGYYQAHKNISQKNDYISFIKRAYSKDEELLLMYIFDGSYKLIEKDIAKKEKIPLIICYIPKLYVEEINKNFNEIINELRFNLKNNGLKELSKNLISKKEKIKKYEKYLRFSFFINCILLLIISYLIFLLKKL